MVSVFPSLGFGGDTTTSSCSSEIMSLLSFEGVHIDIPTTKGIQFQFVEGRLVIQCKAYTGKLVLTTERKIENNNAENVIINPLDTIDSNRERTLNNPKTSKYTEMEIHSNDSNKENQSNAIQEMESIAKESLSCDTDSESTKDTESSNSRYGKRIKRSVACPTSLPSKYKPRIRTTPRKAKGIVVTSVVSNPPLGVTFSGEWTSIEATGRTPAGRWGHTATLISPTSLALYGGDGDEESTLSDLVLFDLVTHKWTCPINCKSIPRSWHSAVHLKEKNLMLVFGGERTIEGFAEPLSDLMALDTEVCLWFPPSVTGATPSARSGHSCSVIGSKVVIFGGSRGRKWQKSVIFLNVDDWRWETHKIDGLPPSPRTYHSATVIGNKLVIFGGNDSKESFNSVHVLEMEKVPHHGERWKWFHPCVVGEPPQPRTGHAAVQLDNTSILIYGGWDPQTESGNIEVFNNSYILKIDTWEWLPVQCQFDLNDEKSMRRVGHSLTVVPSDNTNEPPRLMLIGGQDALDSRQCPMMELTVRSFTYTK